ncbi:AzlD domain-containing protein [Uliginosibacterium sp. sgz301328]|uniref:AzlD domain-containing protein n=1 Tax=Uliginosibacterium sp. sgz301328 TaxID=3243764 RepID=UPI00359E7514
MSDGWLFLTMVACGLVTFLIRLSFIAGGRWLPQGGRFEGFLRYVPPAVLAALIAPDILMRQGQLDVATDNLRMWAALAALLAAWLTRSVLATIAAGMVVLWLLQAMV